MKIIIVNTPKGGVGKTTTSTNIAKLLDEMGYKILVYDVAQGLKFSERFEEEKSKGNWSGIVYQDELADELNKSIKKIIKKEKIDYVVVDTDDYYEILFKLYDSAKEISNDNCIVIAPLTSGEEEIERVARDLSLRGNGYMGKINIKVVGNRIPKQSQKLNNKFTSKFTNYGLDKLVASTFIRECKQDYYPFFISNIDYRNEIISLLKEVKIL